MNFRPDGHLTDEALRALADEGALTELDRLECAEHLAFCDQCLQRYTDLLAGTELMTPPPTLRDSLWRRIRRRAFSLFTSRYATAVAAVTLALTMVWADIPSYTDIVSREEDTAPWTQRWDPMGQAISQINQFFDGLGTRRAGIGGTQP